MQHPCGYGIHPLANTIFQNSTIPLHLWFYALLHFANSAEGVDTPFLSRHLGLSYKASFSLVRRIRLHLASLEGQRLVGGEGKCVSVLAVRLHGIRQSGRNQFPAKLVLLYDGHSVTGMVVTQARRHVLNAVIKMCTIPGSRYITSCAETYRIGTEFGSRSPIMNYSMEFCEDNRSGVAGDRAFYEYLCRPIRDHHRRIDQGNLWLYFSEYLFRFNRRWHSDRIFSDMVGEFRTLDFEAKMAVQERFYHLSNGEAALP